MFKKIAIGCLVTIALAWGGGALYFYQVERKMDSTGLVQLLDAMPAPKSGMVLIDEWNLDGERFLKPRDPEAVRKYVAVGTVDDTCALMDEFYGSREIEIATTSMTGHPEDWCGRTVRLAGGDVNIWVEEINSWTETPNVFSDEVQLVEVRFAAYGG
jgi:hypothetical protein